jgi:hypothetical protein
LGAVAHLVLLDDGSSDYNYVSVFGNFNFKRRMVSVLFCHGEDLGKVYFD